MTTLLPLYHPGEPRAQRKSTYLNEDRTKTGRKRMNLAAVQTIIHHGKASVLPAEMMPEASTIVRIMRFFPRCRDEKEMLCSNSKEFWFRSTSQITA